MVDTDSVLMRPMCLCICILFVVREFSVLESSVNKYTADVAGEKMLKL